MALRTLKTRFAKKRAVKKHILYACPRVMAEDDRTNISLFVLPSHFYVFKLFFYLTSVFCLNTLSKWHRDVENSNQKLFQNNSNEVIYCFLLRVDRFAQFELFCTSNQIKSNRIY